MKAVVKKEFAGCADGETHPRVHHVGDEIEGDLARVAVENGWAEEDKPAPARKPVSRKKK